MELTCYGYLKEAYKKHGNFPAVITMGEKTSLLRFIHDVDNIAAYLNSTGLSSGDTATVFLPNVPHAFTVFYALNKIGVIANIIHPLTSPEVIEQTIEETESKAIFILDILAEKYADAVNKSGIPCIICSNSDYVYSVKRIGVKAYELKNAKGLKNFKNAVPYSKAIFIGSMHKSVEEKDANKTAVYLHGGGTTGKSKTIMLSSININEIAEKLNKFDTVPHKPGSECSLVVLPMFHAFGLAVAMHFPLTHGFTCIPMSQFTGEGAIKLLKKYNITFILGVPNMFKKMFDDEKFKGEHLKKLRLLFCGGDFLSERFVSDFNKAIASCGGKGRLFRGYGLTEVASVCSLNSYNDCRDDSIGKPMDGMTIEIWDEMRKPVASGEQGEIVIKGSTVMQGYFNGRDTVPDDGVYVDAKGERWVMTGDLGYLDEDGFLFFTGRKKRMIIISGYNVYPADIEKAALQLPFVSDVCAVQGYQKGRPCVKLCVTLNDENMDKDDARSAIQSHCKKNLAKFSCPRKIEILDAFPRTKMGKIDFVKLSDQFEIKRKEDK